MKVKQKSEKCLFSTVKHATLVEYKQVTLIQKQPFADVSQNRCF